MIQLKFKGSWRSYQKEVLDQLSNYLNDEKLHIVAAPGAGKTTLGIEVIARLNQNVLIFAPTLTIRNQWKDRILSAFTEQKNEPYISFDIRHPSQITITTYQSLWAAFSHQGLQETPLEMDKPEEEILDSENPSTKEQATHDDDADIIVQRLKDQHISVLCFDEAHHLKNEWWKALEKLVSLLKPKQTIALTATPPYDVSYIEWERYEKLCGPIDESISIPSLVKNGDLCPHQDYVYFSHLRQAESEKIGTFEKNVHTFMAFLMNNQPFQQALLDLDLFDNPEKYCEYIFEEPDFFISLISYLHACGKKMPQPLLVLFDLKTREIPPFDIKLAEIFTNKFLGSLAPFLSPIKEHIKDLKRTLRGKGIIFHGKVYLTSNPYLRREIATSSGKMDSIIRIIESELSILHNNLRLVVLSDFVREDEEDSTTNSLGVVPIFRKVSKAYPTLPMTVLTGRLVIIPKKAKPFMTIEMQKENIKAHEINFTPFHQDDSFLKVNFSESSKNKIVKIITNLFEQGVFQVIVGTQALLGEGWDAPCINSLILSSTISSYVLSNQMRGRAIRKDKNHPEKVANIWHLVSFKDLNLWKSNTSNHNNDLPSDPQGNYTFDMEQIIHRFEGYEAPTMTKPFQIRNGLNRLDLGIISENRIDTLNKRTLQYSRHREIIKKAWNEALFSEHGHSNKVRSGFEPPLHQKSFVFKGSFSFLMSFYSGITLELYSILHRIYPPYAFAIAAVFAVFFIGRPMIKVFKTGSIAGSLRAVIKTTLQTLSVMQEIQTPLCQCKIVVKKDDHGKLFCSVSGLKLKELNLLLRETQEILNPIENPRYVIVRRASFLGFFAQKDYHAVPALISSSKESVAYFLSQWRRNIGSAHSIYTRSIEGRKLLLQTRKYAFSDTARDRTIPFNKWIP